jgi:integrase
MLMPRRGENIYKREDGRWEGRILETNGKYRYFYAKTYKEVKEKQRNHLSQSKASSKKSNQSRSATELFEYWLKNCLNDGIRPSTYDNYYNCVKNYLAPYFSKNQNNRITEGSAASFVKSVKDNTSLADSYKRKILSIFKTALRKTLKGAELESVLGTISLPRVQTSEVQVFTIKEQRLIENAVLESEDVQDLGILLCFYTGIRLGELCALKWSDIDIETGTMTITRTVTRTTNYFQGDNKTMLHLGMPKSQNSARKIPLPDFMMNLSDRLKITANESIYLLSGTETPTDPRMYQKRYKRILKSAGVKDRKFHAIRHTFATRALELGIDIKTLSEILGHANASITLNIYTHSLMEQKKIAIDKLNKLHITQMECIAVKNPVISA